MNIASILISGTIFKTDGTSKIVVLPDKNTLDYLQSVVGGLIECVNINGNDLIVNEEGLINGLPYNPYSELITKGTPWEGQYFFGDIILINGELP